MRKADIDRMATAPKTTHGRIAPEPRRMAQERADGRTANLSRESIDALADAIVARLADVLPICARIAAADTLHTAQRPETVLRDAIAEGIMAANQLREVRS